MAQVKVKSHPSTDNSIVPELFYSYFVVDTTFSPKDMEDMVKTWVNIEDDRDIVDVIVDEELEILMICQQYILVFMMMIVNNGICH